MSKQFTEAVERAFTFLERVGFRMTICVPTKIQYESAHTVLTVTWDTRSGELNVSFGLQPKKGEVHEAFSLSDLLAMEGADVPEERSPFQIADEDKLEPFIEKLAVDTRRYAQKALAGDRMFFRRLEAFRNERARSYMEGMELRRIRSEAEVAWHDRDFDKVVDLYRRIDNRLTASEKARLVYATKHRTH